MLVADLMELAGGGLAAMGRGELLTDRKRQAIKAHEEITSCGFASFPL